MRDGAPWLAIVATATGTSAALADDVAPAKVRRAVFDYAICTVRSHHQPAAKAILSDADNGDIMRLYPQLLDSDCMGRVAGSVAVTFGGDMFRYALADALVNIDLAGQDAGDFADRLPLAHPVMPDPKARDEELAKAKNASRRKSIATSYDRSYSTAILSRYGECVVRANPREARFWILTRTDSSEETSRIRALQTALNQCMPEGTFRFSRSVMRGLVAINYYRLAMATPRPGPEKVH